MQSQYHNTMMPWDPPSYQSHSFERPPQGPRGYSAAPPPSNLFQPDDELSHYATDWIPRISAPAQPQTQALQKPVVIPRLDASGLLGTPFPFIRAYSPDLRQFNIHEKDFVAFIDNLSVAQAPPVPLQALDAAGHVVGIVPHHWTMIAGASMNLVAGVGTAATNTMRTRRFLETVNREYFAPRGLKASICKNRQLEEKLGHHIHVPPSSTLGGSSQPQTAGYRRLQSLMPYIAPLSFNIPPPMEQRNLLDRMAAKQIERRIRKKEQDGYSSDSSISSTSSDSSISSVGESNPASHGELNGRQRRRADKAARKRAKKEERKARKKEKTSRKKDRKGARAHGKQGKKMEKEQKTVEKMEYIVIESLDAPM